MRNTKRFSLPALGLMVALPFLGVSQKLVLEKTYQVDKKAKKGSLNEVIVNPNDNTTTLSFVTKAKGNKVNFQNYVFDKEYNFVKMEEREDVYTSKKFKGEKYVAEGITLEPGMLGGLTVKKKRTEYEWSWWSLSYTWKTTVLDKVKLKDEEGNKFYLAKKYENEATGEIYALVTNKEGQYSLIKINQDLKMEVVEKLSFNKHMGFRSAFMLPQGEEDGAGDTDYSSEDISTSDMCFVFSGAWHPEASKMGEHTDFEMIRMNNQGKILTRAPFKVKGSDWDINNVTSKNGSMYLMGPANPGKPLKNGSVTVSFGDQKFDFFQIAKITGEKADYVTSTSLDEFEAKLKKPASQKKSPEYKGKKFDVRSTKVGKNGELFIYGQNHTKEGKWEDILMFYFDKMGVLKAQYGVRLEERNNFSEINMAKQYMTITDNYAYWEIWELKSVEPEKSLRYPNITKINLSTGEIGEFQKFGVEKDEPTYFLQNTFPYIVNPSDNSGVYLSVNKKGNIFWFGKVVYE